MYKKIFIKKDRAKNIWRGHPWIFSQGIEKKDNLSSGDLCEIHCAGQFVGIGFFNDDANIAIRLLTKEKEIINEKFFIERFKKLRDQKKRFVQNTNAFRLVFGESDNLPGLIIDLYDKVAVLQFHTLGMEKLSDDIVAALKKIIKPRCIHVKDSLHSRKIEGLTSKNRTLYGKLPAEIIINENGFKFSVDIEHGQKTGFFLDQRQNRLNLLDFAKDAKVLNCFSYTGGFSVYAAKVAKSVTSVDISAQAIEVAKKNFELNGFGAKKHQFVVADVFDYLKQLKYGEFDLIILDPPSFARKRNQVPAAIKAYTTINSKALEKLKPGGILVSSSCTAHVDELTFIKILHQSSVNTKCQLKVLHSALQPFDHPYNLNFPEGRYLKFFVLLKD